MDPSKILNEEAYDMVTAARWIANTQADHGTTTDLPLKCSMDLVVMLFVCASSMTRWTLAGTSL